jgi:RimJ/RimL family protein N-acetyltransferase
MSPVAAFSSRHEKINILENHIEGENIYLRELEMRDANQTYCDWLNDPEVNQYLESRFEEWSVEKLRNYVGEIRGNPDYLFLAIILKNGDKHVGNIKIGPINRIHKFADVGIIIGEKSLWGKGFATETIRLAADYAFNTLGLHKLTAGAYANNKGSIKAFENAGFSREGIREKHCLCDGDYVDSILLGIICKQRQN